MCSNHTRKSKAIFMKIFTYILMNVLALVIVIKSIMGNETNIDKVNFDIFQCFIS